jgi:hypothetical protein
LISPPEAAEPQAKEKTEIYHEGRQVHEGLVGCAAVRTDLSTWMQRREISQRRDLTGENAKYAKGLTTEAQSSQRINL